jgi:D-glycero-D-manno-heptose 1,7-bisphosphate phosphatase
MQHQSLIILDRDGVINADSDSYIRSPSEWVPIDSSLLAISLLKHHGYKVAVATNQSGIGRKLFKYSDLMDIHLKMSNMLNLHRASLDKIVFCPHTDTSNCLCRKPKPGMINYLCNFFQVDPCKTFFVGDSLRDIQAAYASSTIPILVLTGNGVKTHSQLLSGSLPMPLVFVDLYHFAATLIQSNYV